MKKPNITVKEEWCDCGRAKIIDKCYMCGAPQCCPACCKEATEEFLQNLKKNQEEA